MKYRWVFVMALRAIAILIIVGTPFVANAQGAKSGGTLLDAVVKKLHDAPSIAADFVMSDGNNRVAGDVIAAGKCFYINAAQGDFQTWFDGKTQWTWTSAGGEVSMTEPTQEELLETNPLAILEASKGKFNVSVAGGDTASKTLNLTPINQKSTNIIEAQIKISVKTNFPENLTVKIKGGGTLSIALSNVRTGNAIDARDFRYKPAYHPDAEIIDLR